MTQNRTSVTKPVFQEFPKQQGGGHPDIWGGESHSRGQVVQQRRCTSRVPINGIVYSKELGHPNPLGSNSSEQILREIGRNRAYNIHSELLNVDSIFPSL